MTKRTDEKSVTKPVKVARLVAPSFLTMVGSPANEVAFKVIRKDGEDMKTAQNPAKIVRHRNVRRMDSSMMIIFPAGTSEDDINEMMQEFGITDFTVSTTPDGVPCVLRADATEPFPENYITVNLKGGVVVRMASTAIEPTDENPLPHIAVTAIEFASTFDDAAVKDWLTRNDIDVTKVKFQTGKDITSVIRSEVAEDIETKRIEIETGVSYVIVRAAAPDVPGTTNTVDVVSEQAYGSWGWGQLDFNAALADEEFCDVAHEGVYMLENVINQILFYSYLPVAVRKELVVRATSQFATYIGALLDALPTRVMLTYRSDLKEKSTMKTKEQLEQERQAAETQRADAAKTGAAAPAASAAPAAAAAAAPAAAAAAVVDDSKPILRSELAGLIATGVAEALKVAGIQRTDGTAVAAAAATAAAPDNATAIADAVRSAVEPLNTTVKALGETVEKLAGATTVRSDGGDPKNTDQKPDVFKGVFLRSSAKQAQA